MTIPTWIDIKIELNDLALDADHEGRTGDAKYARMAINRIEELEEANAALMTERTSLIATKREQLDALREERDMWRARAIDLTR